MKRLFAFVVLVTAAFFIAKALDAQPAPQPPAPPAGINLILYPNGPTELHLHGISGPVHIWWANANPPTGAMTQKQKDEEAAINRLRAIVPNKATAPEKP